MTPPTNSSPSARTPQSSTQHSHTVGSHAWPLLFHPRPPVAPSLPRTTDRQMSASAYISIRLALTLSFDTETTRPRKLPMSFPVPTAHASGTVRCYVVVSWCLHGNIWLLYGDLCNVFWMWSYVVSLLEPHTVCLPGMAKGVCVTASLCPQALAAVFGPSETAVCM